MGARAVRPPRRRGPGSGEGGLKLRRRARLGSATVLVLAAAFTSWLPASAAAAQAATNDPQLTEQLGLAELNLPAAWATSTGEGVVIAVLDSGVDPSHPDLADHLLAGWDATRDREAGTDAFGTGTHAAGAAAAVTDNGEGIAGAAPDARLLPVTVLDPEGRGSAADVAAGVAWAVDHDADVIALTLAGDPELGQVVAQDPVRAAAQAAAEAGVVVVVSAPDTSTSTLADLPAVLVTSGSESGTPPGAVSGPVEPTLSTAPSGPTAQWPDGTDGYETLPGSAGPTAMVAGVAALLVAQGRTPDEVRDLLTATARNPSGEPALGAGTVDAATAVAQAGTTAAGGRSVTEPTGGGLPPALVGGLAVGGALLAVVGTIALANRRPRG